MKLSNKNAIWNRGPSSMSQINTEAVFIPIVAKHETKIHESWVAMFYNILEQWGPLLEKLTILTQISVFF